MSFFLIKSILALFFLASAVSAVLSMLTMMGKAEKKVSPKTLRNINRISLTPFFANFFYEATSRVEGRRILMNINEKNSRFLI